MSKYKGFTQQQAIEYILSHGWKTWDSVENVPLQFAYFWDGVGSKQVAYTWQGAIKEIQKREKGGEG